MRLSPQTVRTARPGMTLIELLVVIAILSLLIALLASGVQKVRVRAYEVRSRGDVQQLSAGIDNFKTKYHVDYLPSRMVLREDGRYGDNGDATLRGPELQTEEFLKKMWPRLIVAAPTGSPAPNSRVAFANTPRLFTDWNGDGAYQQGDAGAYVLEGDQVMTLFLGGLQSGGAAVGFSISKSNPVWVEAADQSREPPIVDMKTDRLAVYPTTAVPYRSPQFRSFIDHFGTMPYAYFSSRGGLGYTVTDCQNLGVAPYYEPTGKYYHRHTHQIICAGMDKTFGTGGGPWDATVGYQEQGIGADDLANFHPMLLGMGTR